MTKCGRFLRVHGKNKRAYDFEDTKNFLYIKLIQYSIY